MGGENGQEWVGIFNLSTPALPVSISQHPFRLHGHSPVKGESLCFPHVSTEFVDFLSRVHFFHSIQYFYIQVHFKAAMLYGLTVCQILSICRWEGGVGSYPRCLDVQNSKKNKTPVPLAILPLLCVFKNTINLLVLLTDQVIQSSTGIQYSSLFSRLLWLYLSNLRYCLVN